MLPRTEHPTTSEVPKSSATGLGNVVVGTDFSEAAHRAVERAAALPFAPGGCVELVHVSSRSRAPDISDRLAAERDWLGERTATVRFSAITGSPAAALCDHARHTRAELVVLGRTGASRLRDRLLGTTAERVVRTGSTSALLVTRPAAGPYRRALVAVDFSESSRLALELTARVCDPSRGEILVVHAASLEAGKGTVRDRERIFADAHERLAMFLAAVPLPIHGRPLIVFGEPEHEILEIARKRDVDLIAVGSAGKGPLRRAVLGSVAEGVMAEAACDVLVARLPELRG